MKRAGLHISSVLLIFATSYTLFHDVLRGDVLIYGRDTQSHDFIMYFYGWRAILQTGIIPLWMPHLFGGIPFIGSFAFCPFYPLQLSFAFLNLPLVFSLQYVLSIFLAGCFFYYFARVIGMSRFVAIFSGLMFLASAHLVTLSYAGHLQKLQAIIWIPLVFAFVHQAVERSDVRRYVLLAAALAMQLLASHFQIFVYTVFAATLFFLWLLFIESSTRRSATDVLKSRKVGIYATLRHALLFLLSIFFAVLLSGAQMFPGAEMARLSNRAAGLSYEQATHSSYPPEELPEIILPRFTGDSTPKGFGTYLGSWGERLVSDYAGAAVIILALTALFLSTRRERFFFLLLFFLSLGLACGKFSPLYKLAYSGVPFISNFRSPATIMIFMTFSLVALAALGLEALLSAERKTTLAALRTFLIVAIGLSLLIAALYYSVGRLKDIAPQLEGIAAPLKREYHRLHFLYAAALHTAFFAAAALLSLSLWLAARAARNDRYYRKPLLLLASALFITVSFADVYINDRVFIAAAPINGYYGYLFTNWSDKALQKETKPARVLELANELTNRMILSGVSSTHGYHPVAYQRYFDLIDHFGFYGDPLSKLLYQRFLKVRDAGSVPPQFSPMMRRHNETLYRRSAPISYAYFPERIEASPDPLTSLAQSQTGKGDPYKVSFVSQNEVARRANTMPSGHYGASVVSYSDNRVEIRTDCSKEAFCIVCDYAVPGWRARLDNTHDIPIYRANHFFRMIRAPRGVHTITFLYEPFSFRLGLFCSLGAVCLALLLLIAASPGRNKTP